MAWLQSELRDVVTSSYGFAGQDGSTITMITTPGRTIPLLQHTKYSESSDQPDEIVIAAYIKGRWYSISMDEMMEMRSEGKKLRISDMPPEMIEDVFGKDYENLAGIRNLDDALDLFTVNIEGGQVVELSSEGLDQIVIPDPTPPEKKQYGSLVKGPKSRPKLETEETEETEALDEAA